MNDYVVCKNENNKIVYQIIEKKDDKLKLEGLNYRKIKYVFEEEIETASDEIVQKENNKSKDYEMLLHRISKFSSKVGTVMHFDSDNTYLGKCEELYRKVGVYCYPVFTKEDQMSEKIEKLTDNFIPDVVVLTGHDLYNGKNSKDLKSYANSEFFIKAVKKIRTKYPLAVIIAGACQSNFEALIANGANFASSPKRVNVHIYDPAIIAIFVCTTSFRKIVDYDKLGKYIVGLKDSYGGIETFGKMKLLY